VFHSFGIGSQLKYSALRKLGISISCISLLEALGAFIFIAIGVWLLTGKLYVGLVFGALASAAAPAATVDVLEEYQSLSPHTTTLLAVVGIDDAIAILLFGFAIATAQKVIEGSGSFFGGLIKLSIEIIASAVTGIILGLLISRILRWIKTKSVSLILITGVILAVCGLAHSFGLSLILTNMVLGIT